jgi:hypothetical protein
VVEEDLGGLKPSLAKTTAKTASTVILLLELEKILKTFATYVITTLILSTVVYI